MIDTWHLRFLDSPHFDVPGHGGFRLARMHSLCTIWLTLGLVVAGCTARPETEPVEDSVTTGRIRIVCSPEAADLIGRQRTAFRDHYPGAVMDLVRGPSREGVRSLFAAEAHLAVVSRELSSEERAAAVRGGLELEGYRFAKDAVVVMVHPDNPVVNMTLEDLRRIYEGHIRDWSVLGGREAPIEPVFPDPESDLAEFFVHHVLGGQPVKAAVVVVTEDSTAVAEVRRRPGAIGFVPLAWAERGTRSLRISGMQGLPYWKPDLETVHDGDYPLSRPLILYVRADAPPLARGMVTFAMSHEGQRHVQQAGLVPMTVPVRFVRRSPMKGAH